MGLTQVRHSLGCYDEIREVENRQVRHCNWVRFVRLARRLSSRVNLVASPASRSGPQAPVLYRVLRAVQPNTELVAFFSDRARKEEGEEEDAAGMVTSTPKIPTERRLFHRTLQGERPRHSRADYALTSLTPFKYSYMITM